MFVIRTVKLVNEYLGSMVERSGRVNAGVEKSDASLKGIWPPLAVWGIPVGVPGCDVTYFGGIIVMTIPVSEGRGSS